jgi:hypothetical protein
MIVALGVGVGVGDGDGLDVGEGDGDGLGWAVGEADGEGCIVGVVEGVGRALALGLGVGEAGKGLGGECPITLGGAFGAEMAPPPPQAVNQQVVTTNTHPKNANTPRLESIRANHIALHDARSMSRLTNNADPQHMRCAAQKRAEHHSYRLTVGIG